MEKFAKVDWEVLKALGGIRIPGEASQVLHIIMHKTYGYSGKSCAGDWISLSQFQRLTSGMKKPSIVRALKLLVSMKIVSEKANEVGDVSENAKTLYLINPRVEEWEPLAKKLKVDKLAKKLTTVSEKANLPLANTLTTIDNITIDNITVDRKHVPDTWRIKAEVYNIVIGNFTEKVVKELQREYTEDNILTAIAKASSWMSDNMGKKSKDNVLRVSRLQTFLKDIPKRSSATTATPLFSYYNEHE